MTPVLAALVVGPATYRPPVAALQRDVEVAAFRIDETPVTNAEFLTFLRSHAEWRRGTAPSALADDGYLGSWAGPLELGSAVDARAPVTRVSWFAAEAYCEARNDRLPTVAQWEVAAAGPSDRPDPTRTERILAWYARPNPSKLAAVGGPPNGWGVRDMDDLVWEWVYDFDADPEAGQKFCGGGGQGVQDPADVATTMRFEMRASLRAAYTTPNLGFRCARSL